MKKFILFFGMVSSLAVVGRAVTIDWTYDDSSDPSSVSLVYFAETGGELSASDFSSDGTSINGAQVLQNADLNDGGATYTGALPSTTSGGYYIVMFDNSSTPASASWTRIAASDISQYDTDAAGSGYMQTGGASMGGNLTFGGWTAVPEPTSVALLLLGVAAFGCKRRKLAL